MNSMVSGKTGLCNKLPWPELTAGVAFRLSKTSPWSSAREKGIDFLICMANTVVLLYFFDYLPSGQVGHGN
jgi:hypothetical protein